MTIQLILLLLVPFLVKGDCRRFSTAANEKDAELYDFFKRHLMTL